MRPELDVDLYGAGVLPDSTGLYSQIRDAGPVVWLPRHRMWAMGRFEDVRAALKDSETFVSGKGIAANGPTNLLSRQTTLNSDGETHSRRRGVLLQSLGAKELAPMRPRIEEEAQAIVDRLVGAGEFDGVADFASGLPVAVIADLVGVRVPTERLLTWGRVTFDGLGPLNRRALGAGPSTIGMLLYSQWLNRERVVPGTWAESVFDAKDAGTISWLEARNMIIDLVAPSLDTTILAAAYMLWALGRDPELWEQVRADPDRIPAAVVEAVRLASPIRGFTRFVAAETEIGGQRLRKGDRVVLLFAAANLDERVFVDPGRFDINRKPAAHLGWGNGPHTCVGIHLAKFEMQALLRALVDRVERIEVGDPEPMLNNTLQGFERYPARLHPRAA